VLLELLLQTPTPDAGGLTGQWPGVLTGGGVVGVLAYVIQQLFRMRESERTIQLATAVAKIDVLEKKVEKCETERTELYAKCKVLESQVEHLTDTLNKVVMKIETMDQGGTQHSLRGK